MTKPAWIRPYLPNTSTAMALVSLRDERPFRAFWRIRLTQIIGGRTWSLALIAYATPTPEDARPGLTWPGV